MSVTINTSATFDISGGHTYGGSSVLSDYGGLQQVRAETVADPATDAVVHVGAGATAYIKALFMSFSEAGSFKIDSGSVVFAFSAGDQILIVGASACKTFLDAISEGTTFNDLKVTSTGDDIVVNVAVLADATP